MLGRLVLCLASCLLSLAPSSSIWIRGREASRLCLGLLTPATWTHIVSGSQWSSTWLAQSLALGCAWLLPLVTLIPIRAPTQPWSMGAGALQPSRCLGHLATRHPVARSETRTLLRLPAGLKFPRLLELHIEPQTKMGQEESVKINNSHFTHA